MTVSTPENQLPQLQVVEKLKSIPVIEQVYSKSTGVYSRVKDSHNIVNWALQSAEGVIGTAVGVVAPIASKFQEPISGVDNKLCRGLDMLEEKVPLVKEQPDEIYKKAKTYVGSNVSELQSMSGRLVDRSWRRGNELLSSHYGSIALAGFDSSSSIADKYIDYFLPASDGEEEAHPHPSAECEDKILHTIHTVGTLSNKVGTRVYRSLSRRFSEPRQV